MEIERLDEADALVVGREQADDQGVAPPETRDQQAYRAEYRATVEAAYTWDAAALELRQVWEAHETKWPSPEDADRDGDRSLNPEANAEVERGCGQIREIAENIITPAMRAIESEDPDRHLIGLEHHLKGTERLKEKVAAALEARPGLSRRASAGIGSGRDQVHALLQRRAIHSGGYCDLERLTACGCEFAKPPKNSWEGDQYKGINTQWREPETGQLFEVQFHTRASFEAKQLSHAAYERIRNPRTSDAELPNLRTSSARSAPRSRSRLAHGHRTISPKGPRWLRRSPTTRSSTSYSSREQTRRSAPADQARRRTARRSVHA